MITHEKFVLNFWLGDISTFLIKPEGISKDLNSAVINGSCTKDLGGDEAITPCYHGKRNFIAVTTIVMGIMVRNDE